MHLTALGHFGLFPDGAVYRERPDLGGCRPDLAVGNLSSTAGDFEWRHFFFCPVEGPFFDGEIPTGALKQAVDNLECLEDWLADHRAEAAIVLLAAAGESRSSRWDDHRGLILASRRDLLSKSDRSGIRSLRDRGIEVRSYDWLIEACAMSEPARSLRRLPVRKKGTDDL
jgi:hypothetical protein